jgi:maleylacetate reductase
MTPDPMTFSLPRLERVISGAGSVSQLTAELDRLRATRVVLVTGRTLGASALVGSLTRQIGHRCVCVFTGARQHVPSDTVAALARIVDEQKADALVSFGGGSPIDTAKAAVLLQLTSGGSGVSIGDGPAHVAIPTTLSAGEFTLVAGITDERTRIKRPVHDARIAPRTVIADPLLTVETPDWLWVATGIRALDHAVETIYSVRHHPAGDAMASRGLAMMTAHLPGSVHASGDKRIDHRHSCQLAAWLCVFGMTNAGFGLSHALGHQIGPRWDVPHGFTSCITLPHAMRFMADRVPERFNAIAAGLGIPFDSRQPRESAIACADRIEGFVAGFPVPRRLRDAQVPHGEIGEIAAIVRDAMDEANAVSRPVTREEIVTLLDAAY